MSDSETYWTGSWNCILGCEKLSPGCRNCWALSMVKRGFGHDTDYGGACANVLGPGMREWNKQAVFLEGALDKPLRWKKPRTIAVNWLGDMFRPEVPKAWIDRVLDVACSAPQHQYLFLTKRAEALEEQLYGHDPCGGSRELGGGDHPKGAWWGLTVCNQAEYDVKTPYLLHIPGQRWLSLEPLLSAVDLDALNAAFDWIVVGAETGPGARECKAEWVQSIVDQGAAAGVPVWVKKAPPPKLTDAIVDEFFESGHLWPREKPAGMP